MAIDTSFYQTLKPVQVDTPDVAGSLQKGLSLSQLALQNQQTQLQMGTNQAIRSLYAKHTGANGKLDQQSFLSDLAKVNPQASLSMQEQLGKADKGTADAQGAQMDTVQKIVGQTLPAMNYLAGLPEQQRATQYGEVMKHLESQGVPMNNIPKDSNGNYMYDPGHFAQSFGTLRNTAADLANQKTVSEIGKNRSEIAMAPAKLSSDLYGSRSPNAELTSQYSSDVKPIRGSQGAMAQMMDNYKNPSPQGDASLVLNAFKIKFPNAPDVNSLEELTKSQSVPDTWRAKAAHAMQGGLDQPTRDNLMRDAVSTFRANYDTYQGIKDRYQARQKQQNVNDPTLTYEPALDKTYGQAMDIQKQIGPYVPPAERSGVIAGISRLAGNVMGTGPAAANAKEGAQLPPPPQGMIRVRSPQGKVGLIPASQRGEAIAAGGSVVQ